MWSSLAMLQVYKCTIMSTLGSFLQCVSCEMYFSTDLRNAYRSGSTAYSKGSDQSPSAFAQWLCVLFLGILAQSPRLSEACVPVVCYSLLSTLTQSQTVTRCCCCPLASADPLTPGGGQREATSTLCWGRAPERSKAHKQHRKPGGSGASPVRFMHLGCAQPGGLYTERWAKAHTAPVPVCLADLDQSQQSLSITVPGEDVTWDSGQMPLSDLEQDTHWFGYPCHCGDG